jgi:phage terminase small subunit
MTIKREILTDKQELFCNEYLKDLNGTQAAIRAGYSEKTASEQAYQLLQLPQIQDRIRELNEERMKRLQADGDYVVKELLSIVKDDISNYLTLKATKTGKLIVKWKDLTQIDTKNISEFQKDKNGFKFKRYSRENALIQLGRHFGIFEDKITLKSNLEKLLLEYSENGILTDEGINRLAEIILKHQKKSANE